MGLAWAIADILTPANLTIATIAALVGYIVLEFLRSKFWGTGQQCRAVVHRGLSTPLPSRGGRLLQS